MEEIQKDDRYYTELANYLGLPDQAQARLYDMIETEYLCMGEWGSKIVTYLRSVLSKGKQRGYILEADRELLRKILQDSLSLLELELEKKKE